MSKAGKHEKNFQNLIQNQLPKRRLTKQRWFPAKTSQRRSPIRISVDKSVQLKDGRQVLIEIDSNNAAKVVAGQYALLNGVFKKDRTKTLFLVIHYYKSYNPDRTVKALNAIQSLCPSRKWIPFRAWHIRTFKQRVRKHLKGSGNLLDFFAGLFPVTNRPRN